jgi:hypothetical protein
MLLSALGRSAWRISMILSQAMAIPFRVADLPYAKAG